MFPYAGFNMERFNRSTRSTLRKVSEWTRWYVLHAWFRVTLKRFAMWRRDRKLGTVNVADMRAAMEGALLNMAERVECYATDAAHDAFTENECVPEVNIDLSEFTDCLYMSFDQCNFGDLEEAIGSALEGAPIEGLDDAECEINDAIATQIADWDGRLQRKSAEDVGAHVTDMAGAAVDEIVFAYMSDFTKGGGE